MKRLIGICSLMVLFIAGVIYAQNAGSTTPPVPSTQASGAAEVLMKIRSLMGRPRARSQAEYLSKLKKSRQQALVLLDEMEKKYPKSKELDEARLHGIVASMELGRIMHDPKMGEKVEQIAKKVLASNAPPFLKLNADAYTVLLKVRPIRTSATQPVTTIDDKAAEKIILDMTNRYRNTKVRLDALLIGMQLADLQGLDTLITRLEDIVLKEFPQHTIAQRIRKRRELSMVGKEFTASLTKLDGKKLNLPKDLLGKVVVIDFWATWCAPCVTEIPHMKELYNKYKSKGVEIVSISLDKDKSRLEKFISQHKITWVQTFTGKGWEDPTARKYNINAIPSIWVIGKDGKVVSDRARGRLAKVIERALKAKEPANDSSNTKKKK
ncbi:MAG: TlpA family protein disulfide reductase [Planctomycetes bacterium]|nr:TlpA family protein disulfide reductase [Planctomycetota bacterium]